MATNNKVLEIVIKAKDEASKTIADATSSIKGKINDLQPTFQKMATVGVASFTAIAVGVGLSVKAYAESEEQLTRVDAILQTVADSTKGMVKLTEKAGGSFSQLTKKVREFGAELQAKGGIGDEAGAEGLAKLLQITQDFSKAQNAANIAADLATFKQIDYAQAVDIVGKVLGGNTAILQRYGIQIDDTATAEEALAILAKKTQGQYVAYGKTLAGQLAILKQSFGDLQENIGQAFLPILQKTLEVVRPYIDAIVKWTSENQKLVAQIVLFAGAITGLIAAIGVLGVALPAIIAGFGFLLSTAGLVTIAVGTLGAGILWLAQNWDTVTSSVSRFIEKAQENEVVIFFVNQLKEAFIAVKQVVLEQLWPALQSLWETVKMQLWPAIQELWVALQPLMPFFEYFAKFIGAVLVVALWTLINVITALTLVVVKVLEWMTKWYEFIIKSVVTGVKLATDGVKAFGDAFTSLGELIDKAIKKLKEFAEASGASKLISKVTSLVGGKASGGGVMGGKSYLVGEQGPELFTPSSNGSITPNDRLGKSSGVNLTINMNGGTYLDPRVAEDIGDMIIQQFKKVARI